MRWLKLVGFWALLMIGMAVQAQTTPFIELYVSPTGNDSQDGSSPQTPLQTLGAAWAHLPEDTFAETGYRINLLPGEYPCEGDCINFFSNRHGTSDFPLVIRAANGRDTVTLLGGLNLMQVSYLTLEDLTLRAGDGLPLWGNNVLHCEGCSYFWMRGLTITGPKPNPDNYDIQEVLKINQSDHVYLEDSDLSGTFQTVLDYVSVQYGHILDTRIHGSLQWCAYVKGGSAYLRFERNEFYECGLGFQAGEGSNLEIMRAPYLQYEAYDVRVVNNYLHDIPGVALSVVGGYNILLAHNTLMNIGTFDDGSGIGYPLVNIAYGGRVCVEMSENGEGNAAQVCGEHLAAGAWGTSQVGMEYGGEVIPNRNVWVYNNLFYNPHGHTLYSHFTIRGVLTLPAGMQNIPSGASADDGLQIRGNVIWNGDASMPVGVEDASTGCQMTNPTCNLTQLLADNTINQVEPTLTDGMPKVTGVDGVTIPDFTWEAAVSPGALSNAVPLDYAGNPRTGHTPGA